MGTRVRPHADQAETGPGSPFESRPNKDPRGEASAGTGDVLSLRYYLVDGALGSDLMPIRLKLDPGGSVEPRPNNYPREGASAG